MEVLNNKFDGLINPEELESKIITVGELNNLLGNDIALLKIIDVELKYNHSIKELKEIKGTKDPLFKTLEADVDIYIKVLTTKKTYYLKVREELDSFNPTPVTLDLLEKLIAGDIKKGFKHKKITNPKHIKHSYFFSGVSDDGTIFNRFKELIDIEFLVTGLGLEIDPRFNILDGLIILDGVPRDYRKIELE